MIGMLHGTVQLISRESLIIDVNGVGYVVNVSARVLQQAGAGENMTLWIHTHVREDNLDLYGFLKTEELEFFKALITVSGIGPKTAIGIMNFELENIKKAIISGDADFFSGIPRLGKKNAQKIIIELRSKIGSFGDLDLTETDDHVTKDVTDALIGMGFSKAEIKSALQKIQTDQLSSADILRQALKLLG